MKNLKPSLFLLLILAAAILFGCVPETPQDFISTDGVRFMEGTNPYYFAGTNFWYGTYLGMPGKQGNRDRLERELDALQDLGLTNLRILGGSEQPYMDGMLTPSIQTEPGVYNEQILVGLDYLLAEMAERDMRAVVFLTNYWEWSGGMSQYVAWSRNEEKGPDPNAGEGTWAEFMDYSASFYADSIGQTWYRQYIEHIVTRINTINGRPYADDPTIMAWELANEPRPGSVSETGNTTLPHYISWIDETARYISSLDTNHLVTTGSEGIIGSLVSEENFVAAHSSPSIDYLTVHVWPYNWQWFDPLDIEGTLDSAEIKAISYIQDHFDLARDLNKPLVLEEFGLARDSAFFSEGSSVEARDRYFRTVLGMVYDSAATGAPIAGTNFWAWSGEGRGPNEDGRWKEGDPLVGDPPHEPQGINSVFSTDHGTIEILGNHAERMNSLRRPPLAEKDDQ